MRLGRLLDRLSRPRRRQKPCPVPLAPATIYGTRRGSYAASYVDQEATQIIQEKPLMTLGAEYRANQGRHYR